jgi:hypothetical protein
MVTGPSGTETPRKLLDCTMCMLTPWLYDYTPVKRRPPLVARPATHEQARALSERAERMFTILEPHGQNRRTAHAAAARAGPTSPRLMGIAPRPSSARSRLRPAPTVRTRPNSARRSLIENATAQHDPNLKLAPASHRAAAVTAAVHELRRTAQAMCEERASMRAQPPHERLTLLARLNMDDSDDPRAVERADERASHAAAFVEQALHRARLQRLAYRDEVCRLLGVSAAEAQAASGTCCASLRLQPATAPSATGWALAATRTGAPVSEAPPAVPAAAEIRIVEGNLHVEASCSDGTRFSRGDRESGAHSIELPTQQQLWQHQQHRQQERRHHEHVPHNPPAKAELTIRPHSAAFARDAPVLMRAEAPSARPPRVASAGTERPPRPARPSSSPPRFLRLRRNELTARPSRHSPPRQGSGQPVQSGVANERVGGLLARVLVASQPPSASRRPPSASMSPVASRATAGDALSFTLTGANAAPLPLDLA